MQMRTVSADYSQGNEALFGEDAGKQCVAMSLTAIIIKITISSPVIDLKKSYFPLIR